MSRKLDAAIADALGYEVEVKRGLRPCCERYYINMNENRVPLPDYSTDGNAMLELDKEMRERGYMLTVKRGYVREKGCFFVGAKYWDVYSRCGDCLEKEETLARALAAYAALTGKEWKE